VNTNNTQKEESWSRIVPTNRGHDHRDHCHTTVASRRLLSTSCRPPSTGRILTGRSPHRRTKGQVPVHGERRKGRREKCDVQCKPWERGGWENPTSPKAVPAQHTHTAHDTTPANTNKHKTDLSLAAVSPSCKASTDTIVPTIRS
jgi:hypothetical protein